MGFNIIDRYIARTVLVFILVAAIALSFLSAIITFIDQTRHLGQGNVDFMFLLFYVALRTPSLTVMLFPIAVLIGCVVGLGILSKNSELVVMQSIGMSKTKIILSACKMIFPIAILVGVAGQTVVPEIKQYAESSYNFASSEGRLSRVGWGFWIREGNSFVYIRRTMSDNSIHEISRYDFDGTKLLKRSHAATGLYNNEHSNWDMFKVRSYIYDDKNITIEDKDIEHWDLYLTPERLEVFNLNNEELTVYELLDYIDYLETNNINSDRYRTVLYKKVLMPLSIIVMLLLGASTVFGSLRTVPMSARVLLGLLIGFLFYLTNEILPNFTYLVGLPPSIGVSLPLIFFTLISILVLNRNV
ncbi:LPS export ABC transporter permease LptG [Anaerobiospirillum sp. NML120448]|uniref:LPS export ABC transporter permease LptG n=1 Tax=Anaerobiospirillum sp. NML120448 TaxID=2932816 RepID=UPI001FF47C8C|nr:LPS export ABC transporter permease LptG [Anaerobiospirillum sp. NML120448]MCK0513431.1 LPS export ABC transporter permease LptG [Anaerobiospirillum sp. NML120448]